MIYFIILLQMIIITAQTCNKVVLTSNYLPSFFNQVVSFMQLKLLLFHDAVQGVNTASEMQSGELTVVLTEITADTSSNLNVP